MSKPSSAASILLLAGAAIVLVACIARPWVGYTTDDGDYLRHGLVVGQSCSPDFGCRSISLATGDFGMPGTLAMMTFLLALIGALTAIATAFVLLRRKTVLVALAVGASGAAALLTLALFGQIGRDLAIHIPAYVFLGGCAVLLAGGVVAIARRTPRPVLLATPVLARVQPMPVQILHACESCGAPMIWMSRLQTWTCPSCP